jgi:hypothetical protein
VSHQLLEIPERKEKKKEKNRWGYLKTIIIGDVGWGERREVSM